MLISLSLYIYIYIYMHVYIYIYICYDASEVLHEYSTFIRAPKRVCGLFHVVCFHLTVSRLVV